MINLSELVYNEIYPVLVGWKIQIGNTDDSVDRNCSIYETGTVQVIEEYSQTGLVGFGIQIRLRGKRDGVQELIQTSSDVIATLYPLLGSFPVYLESYIPNQRDQEGRGITTMNFHVFVYGGINSV